MNKKAIQRKCKEGWFPSEFHGLELEIQDEDREFNVLRIFVTNMTPPEAEDLSKKYERGYHFVLVVFRFKGRDIDHCMYVMTLTSENNVLHFECLDSLPGEEQRPLIPVKMKGNTLHKVEVEVESAIEFSSLELDEQYETNASIISNKDVYQYLM